MALKVGVIFLFLLLVIITYLLTYLLGENWDIGKYFESSKVHEGNLLNGRYKSFTCAILSNII